MGVPEVKSNLNTRGKKKRTRVRRIKTRVKPRVWEDDERLSLLVTPKSPKKGRVGVNNVRKDGTFGNEAANTSNSIKATTFLPFSADQFSFGNITTVQGVDLKT